MTDSAFTPDDLSARIVALEGENTRLREQAPPASARKALASGRWRAWASAVCIVIAAILVPISIVTAWARVQLVDEDAFVRTLSPLASDSAVQAMIADQTMDAITQKVDFAQLTSSVIDGVATLDLPPAALSALTLLKQPAADGLESLVNGAVTRVVTSDAFADIWTTTTRAAHRALTTVATSDGAGLVVRTNDGVGIQLGAIVERVAQNLTDQGVGIANLIPSIDRVVILSNGDNLALVRGGYAVTTAVGSWLPLLALGLFIAGILLARRRPTALLGSGIGLLIGGGSLALGISIGALAMSTVATQIDLPPGALDSLYHQFFDEIAHVSSIIAVVGLVVAVLAWVHGRSRAATAVRTGMSSINVGLRAALASRGVDTGSFGRWMFRHRKLVRVILPTLAIIWLLLLRPLTLGEIILVLAVSLIVWWLAELVEKRPDEATTVVPDAAAPSSATAAPAADEASDDVHTVITVITPAGAAVTVATRGATAAPPAE